MYKKGIVQFGSRSSGLTHVHPFEQLYFLSQTPLKKNLIPFLFKSTEKRLYSEKRDFSDGIETLYIGEYSALKLMETF